VVLKENINALRPSVAFRSRSVLYASLSDLAQLLDLTAEEHGETRRLEITRRPTV